MGKHVKIKYSGQTLSFNSPGGILNINELPSLLSYLQVGTVSFFRLFVVSSTLSFSLNTLVQIVFSILSSYS